MTIRVIFQIILKVLGVFFIKDILATLPHLLSVGLFLFGANSGAEGLWTLATTLLVLFVYCLVAYCLIFRTDRVIDKLRLDEGFTEQSITWSIHRSTVLSICVIVIGGLIVVDGIPELCRQLFSYFQERRMTFGQTDPSISYSVLSAAKILIGLLLIGSQRQIVNYIEHRRRK
ncbi:hypothetical protein [Flaviaesturariibacter amylovorans]|uniref:Uncharacterized protein n=1 Tax=Flaviaesturariibacter amylovorans TaxID=1084520 RepID=A0ABP8G508_9BACT